MRSIQKGVDCCFGRELSKYYIYVMLRCLNVNEHSECPSKYGHVRVKGGGAREAKAPRRGGLSTSVGGIFQYRRLALILMM